MSPEEREIHAFHIEATRVRLAQLERMRDVAEGPLRTKLEEAIEYVRGSLYEAVVNLDDSDLPIT
jgi:hypothetical protein